MKTYLVGGAVRDKLLKINVKERDWVVVGASFDELLNIGYKKVGKDFPVFLHPKTNEEYALARTERKNGVGYYGFTCNFGPSITLEEDLARRDLTINAIAEDENGNIIDPYNGKLDIKNKILRHVSDAFVEDPVRVLRVARFAARFYHLGFKVADETISLMRKMVENGEVDNLIKERVWQEWQKSLQERTPEIFICALRACGALDRLIPEINNLFGVPSNILYHEEIDTGVHTLMVLNKASSLSNDPTVRFAALVHDLGKANTLRTQWPSQKGHEALGVEVICELANRLNIPQKYVKISRIAAKLHLNIHKIKELTSSEILDTLEQADAFRRPELFENLLLVCEADALGRGLYGGYPHLKWFFPNGGYKNISTEYYQAKYWLGILKTCKDVEIDNHIEAGLHGLEIKYKIREMRLNIIIKYIKTWDLNEKQ
ncbi:MAG: multifunctional CCA tRNA nucleotidyl transferase/2'3'-cyclic phosphodiesterase/2'nucleotidase/phosphatase [Legionellales bacterium RIFCSPHIGHO2_12_FULL_35_11]|nr:MAG: multifunctional CCA tRNA nucleotidyl transferase/2'3'-cyclic phosphodiesterase/2'nucleotidase/phosphatase [Legionellales bacterium RIFCSPHIGHO2_12_FULL_35_11]